MKKIISIVLVSLLCIGIVGCSKQASPSDIVNNYMKTKISEAKNDLSEYLGDSSDKTSDLFGGSEELNKEFCKLLTDLDYKVSNEEIDEDYATVDLTVTTYDFRTFLSNVLTDYISKAFSIALSGGSDEDIAKELQEISSTRLEETKNNGKTYTDTITIDLIKGEEGWIIDPDYDLEIIANVFSGGMGDVSKLLGSALSE